MKVELKDYGKIGTPRLLDLKIIYTTLENLEQNKHESEQIIWEGKSEDIPENIANLHYYKCTLGRSTIYYVIEK